MLLAVQQSPKYALAQDKSKWLGLFAHKQHPDAAPSSFIEDPVGAPKHYDISTFYDVFIKPNRVTFDVQKHSDIVDTQRREVIRNVDLNIDLAHGGVSVIQPAIIKYHLNKENQLLSLQAYWTMFDMKPNREKYPLNNMTLYPRFLFYSTLQFARIMFTWGLVFTTKYLFSFVQGYMSNGRNVAMQFAHAVTVKDTAALQSLFVSHMNGNKAAISLPGLDEAISVNDFLSKLSSKGYIESIYFIRAFEAGTTTACMWEGRVNKVSVTGCFIMNLVGGKIQDLSLYYNEN